MYIICNGNFEVNYYVKATLESTLEMLLVG